MSECIKTVLVAALIALAGCSNQSVEVSEVLNYHDCRNLTAGLRKIDFEDLAALRGAHFIGGSIDQRPTIKPPEDLTLIAISKGPQQTPGYALALADPSLRSSGDTVHIKLIWSSPPADALLAQMLTHPCLVIGVQGSVAEVEVSDQLGSIGHLNLTQ